MLMTSWCMETPRVTMMKTWEICLKTNIKLNLDKSVFKTTEVEFLGHLVTNKGLKPDVKKVEAILGMENPTDVEGVRRL